MGFNKSSRKRNAILLSGSGVLNQIVSNVAAFIYRTVFIYWLSVEYLGITGLFTNIIQVFSLAELGIGSVISYRLYKPIKEDDVDQTAALMHFYKRFYQIMAITILGVGVFVAPFLPYVIRDASEIPSDVNLYIVYALYIFESATSYTFAYRQALLDADQKGYLNTFVQMICTCLRYIISIILLYFTRNYTLVLTVGIAVNLVRNIGVYFYVGSNYSDVFRNKSRLVKNEIRQIYKDTSAMMCHRIGATVVTSTDNIVMSMYIGTVAVGKYSNYFLIIQIVQNIMGNLLGGFTASIGNYALAKENADKYQLYKKLRFANMWISVFCTSSLYLLLNPFIGVVWGEDLLFSKEVVLVLCISFFLTSTRIVNSSFSSASGLFLYDKVRPLIESALNLIVSIYLAQKIGIAGVFIGTIVSSVLTVWWREPYLLHKHVFKESLKNYYGSYLIWTALLIMITGVLEKIFVFLPLTPAYLGVRFLICGIGINIFLVILMCKSSYFAYYVDMIRNIVRKGKKIC